MRGVTTQRGEDPAVLPEGEDWFARPEPRLPADDAAAGPGRGANGHLGPDGHPGRDGRAGRDGDLRPGGASADGSGPGRDGHTERDGHLEPDVAMRRDGDGGTGEGAGGAGSRLRTGRRRRRDGGDGPAVAREDGFDPGDTGTWRVREVVPGMDGGRRHTTILRYLLGLLAVDRLRSLTRWAWAVPVLGLVLLLVRPRWIGAAVVVLGVLLVAGRVLATRLIARRSLARRYRPVEDDLRAAVEAGKANLRGEMERVGLPTGRWSLPVSVLRLARGGDRSADRSKLREVEIHRILPEAQLQRALKILDEAGSSAR